MAHTHSHVEMNGRKRRFFSIILLNFLISIFEVIFGVVSGSLALISDAFHNFEDTASLIISYIAWSFSFKAADYDKTYGYKRAEVIAAFVNSLFLFAVCVFLITQSVQRFFHPEEIKGRLMMMVAAIAFVGNIVSVVFLHKDSEHNMNWKSAYLHMLGDALFSLAVFIGAFFIKNWRIYWIDPALSIGMAAFIIYQTWTVFKNAFNILMQASPGIDYAGIKEEIEKMEGVRNIHHTHSWMVNEETLLFEAHIEVDDCMVSETCAMQNKIESILADKFGISHITLQFETDKCKDKEMIHR